MSPPDGRCSTSRWSSGLQSATSAAAAARAPPAASRASSTPRTYRPSSRTRSLTNSERTCASAVRRASKATWACAWCRSRGRSLSRPSIRRALRRAGVETPPRGRGRPGPPELVRPRDRARVRRDRAAQGRARGPLEPPGRTPRRQGVRHAPPLPRLPRRASCLLPGPVAEETAPQAPSRGYRLGGGRRARPRARVRSPRRLGPRGVLRADRRGALVRAAPREAQARRGRRLVDGIELRAEVQKNGPADLQGARRRRGADRSEEQKPQLQS